jgi:hypothetical protein
VRERGGERLGPRPVAIELELGAPAVTHELGRDVKQPLLEAFRLGFGELAVKADQLRPAE